MLVLLGIGFLAGFVTAISPCVLPVLPILLAGGASGRKPLRIIAGLVVSFVVFTLFATWLLDKLGLPTTCCGTSRSPALPRRRDAALPAGRGGRSKGRSRGSRASGPAAAGSCSARRSGSSSCPAPGPVLATIAVVAATNHVGGRAIALTLAYATGAAVPLLLIAYGGQGLGRRLRADALASASSRAS